MGKSKGAIPQPNYLSESSGEKRDRLAGTSETGRMHEARKQDVSDHKLRVRRWGVNASVAFTALAIACLITVLATDAWWHYDATNPTVSTEGFTITRQQIWGVSFLGLSVKVEYCRQDLEDSCDIEREQFRYFDNTKNKETTWSGNWIGYAAEADEGSVAFIACFSLGLFAMAFVSTVTGTVFCGRLNRKLIIAAFVAAVGWFVLWSFGTFWFILKMQPLLKALEDDNFVPDTTSVLEPAYGMIVMFVGCFAAFLVSAAVWKLIPVPAEDDAAVLAVLQGKHKERKARRLKWFSDIEAGTHMYEHDPLDSFTGTRTVGWTQHVDSEVVNVLHEVDDESMRVLPIKTAFAKDPQLQTPTIPNRPMPSNPGAKASSNNILQQSQPQPNGFNPMSTLQMDSKSLARLSPGPGVVLPGTLIMDLEPETKDGEGDKTHKEEEEGEKESQHKTFSPPSKRLPPLPGNGKSPAVRSIHSPPAKKSDPGFELPRQQPGSASRLAMYQCACDNCEEARKSGKPGNRMCLAKVQPPPLPGKKGPPPLPGKKGPPPLPTGPVLDSTRQPVGQRVRPVTRAPETDKSKLKSSTFGEIVITNTTAPVPPKP